MLVIQSKCGKFSDLSSVCSKMLVHVKIFQFQDMLNESERYWDETNGLVRKHFFQISTKCEVSLLCKYDIFTRNRKAEKT